MPDPDPRTEGQDDPFARARHTVVLSDVHLTEAEEPDPRRPLWKRFKHRDLFVDDELRRFFEWIVGVADGAVELVLNGDLFDFDCVLALPDRPDFRTSRLERLRGLSAEEAKSVFKIRLILEHHPVFVAALRDFLLGGHRVVMTIGNHDMELHWPAVQAEIRAALDLPEEAAGRLRFCEWFFVSNGDTLIEHGNQFDSYCLCSDPLHPLVRLGGKTRVRLPFGDLAGRYMLNGMGMFNPLVEESFLGGIREYVVFFYRYVVRVQPFLLLTYLWSALVTLVVSLREGFLPSVKDPLTLQDRVEDVARRSNVKPGTVHALRSLAVHPAIFNPWKIARELWLDRVGLFLLVGFASFQVFSVLNVFVRLSVWWIAVPFFVLLAPFVFYAQSVQSEVSHMERVMQRQVPKAARIAGVSRVVLGHTHRERHTGLRGVELINTGTWSPAYHDVECTRPYGRKCFAWIKPDPAGVGRIAELRVWNGEGSEVFRPDAPPRPRVPTLRRVKAVRA